MFLKIEMYVPLPNQEDIGGEKLRLNRYVFKLLSEKKIPLKYFTSKFGKIWKLFFFQGTCEIFKWWKQWPCQFVLDKETKILQR